MVVGERRRRKKYPRNACMSLMIFWRNSAKTVVFHAWTFNRENVGADSLQKQGRTGLEGSMEKRALFCYGTLQSPLVMKAVTGKEYKGQVATLVDWVRFRVRGSEYPGIIRMDRSSVAGKLYWDLDEHAMEKLDEFEGERYERVIVHVDMSDGDKAEAWAYAIKDDCRDSLSEEPWDFDRFMQYGFEKFIQWFVEDRRDLFDRGDL